LRNVGITPDEVRQLFAEHFALENLAPGAARGARASAWYWLRKQ
jgi:hypothetical protein